ncbi:AraC family ligand binding domain-containing protein [Thermocatellispora tengchongensis]|uniref:AraC family ligand binding domain-containing protein n=1 Tax=Thermocatellispora tengchongensis TaxID=1073253 RepID=UPI00363938D5
MARVTRTLPALAAGPVEMPFAIVSWSEDFAHDTAWNEHSHPFHELLWNERGASTAVVGARVWTVTPTLGLWMPAGTLHSGLAVAGTWCRANFFGFGTMTSISPTPVGVEITPLLRLLLERLADTELSSHSRAVTEAMVLDVLTPPRASCSCTCRPPTCCARSPTRSARIPAIRAL